MYYQGLLSLIAPSQMMICGTLTLRYLFRIVLSGAVAKGEDFITSGSVTRQGIHTITGSYDAKKQITLPIALKCYVLGTACTNSIHQMEAALVTNKTAAGFKTSWLI